MNEFEIWVYRGIIAVLFVIVWAVIRMAARKILEELKCISDSLRRLSDALIIHDGDIKLVKDHITSLENRVTDHSHRIRGVETKQDKCNYCNDHKNG